jgi:hypothetical protein
MFYNGMLVYCELSKTIYIMDSGFTHLKKMKKAYKYK